MSFIQLSCHSLITSLHNFESGNFQLKMNCKYVKVLVFEYETVRTEEGLTNSYGLLSLFQRYVKVHL
jgi:hypothetical protein